MLCLKGWWNGRRPGNHVDETCSLEHQIPLFNPVAAGATSTFVVYVVVTTEMMLLRTVPGANERYLCASRQSCIALSTSCYCS